MLPKKYTRGDETWLRVGDVVNEQGRTFRVEGFTHVEPEDPQDYTYIVADVTEWDGNQWVACATKLDPQHGAILT
jgi:hypothetical protein